MSIRIALGVLLLPVGLSAQRPDTTVVPIEFARALAGINGFGGGQDPRILVGRVADAKLASLVPRSARIIGGVVYPDQRNPHTTTILAMPEVPDSALGLVTKALESAGYKAAPTFEEMSGERGGIVASSSSRISLGRDMPFLATTYCSDSGSIFVSVSEAEGRGSMVRLSTSTTLRNTMCDARQRGRAMRYDDGLELPTLRPPPGATGGSHGSSGSSDSRETRAQLRSTLSAAEMIDHFGPQLREQGWTLVNRATDGDVSVQTARRTNREGEPIFLTLIDVRSGPREHDVTLRVWRQSQDR